MALLRPTLVALGAHLVTAAALDLVGAGAVRWGSASLAVLPAVAIGAVHLARRVEADLAVPVAVAVAWFLTGLVHHYVVGISPRWDGRPLSGAEHVVWDLVFHLPPIALAVGALHRRAPAT